LYFVEESKENFSLGFLPQEGFLGYTYVLSVIVSLSMILIYADVLVCWLYAVNFLNLSTCIIFSTINTREEMDKVSGHTQLNEELAILGRRE